MKNLKTILIVFCITLVVSCSNNDDDVDTQKPTISLNYVDGFPKACAVLKKGETYTFRAKTNDNIGLEAYSIDIHHNFDHHTHDDQELTCTLSDKKGAKQPLIYMESFTISGMPKSYEINQEISIPENIDVGDYHCEFSVIDKTGWQSRTSVDIKIIE